MTIGITGATGQLGRLVISALKTRAADTTLVAIVRSPEKAADLGVIARYGDYDDLASLRDAFEGIETLLLISGSEVGKREAQHANAIEAAKAAGVRRVVYTSLLSADTSGITMLADEHVATEAALKASGLEYTILRNGWYTENYTASLGGTLQAGGLYGAAGDGKYAMATRQDYAEAAAVVLTEDGHAGKTYELAGDEAVTLAQFAAIISEVSGKTIPYTDLPASDYAAALTGFGLPQFVADMLAQADAAAKEGALYDDSHQLSALIGRPTTPVRDTVAAALS